MTLSGCTLDIGLTSGHFHSSDRVLLSRLLLKTPHRRNKCGGMVLGGQLNRLSAMAVMQAKKGLLQANGQYRLK